MKENKQLNALERYNTELHEATREAIKDAMMLLAQEKSYDSITVTEIIHKAGVSRSAFYKNYKSKQSVLIDILDSLLDEGIKLLSYTTSYREKVIVLYNTFLANKGKFQLLLNAGLEGEILKRVNEKTVLSTMPVKNRIYNLLWNGALYNFFIEWIKPENDIDLDSIIAIADDLNVAAALLPKQIG